MRIEITKGKITKNNTLEVDYLRHNDDESISEVHEKLDAIVHPDLVNAFQSLAPHMALLCDLREGDIIGKGKNKYHIEEAPAEHFDKFEIRSFSIGGNADSEGVCISGNKKLNASQVFNITTPFQKYEDEMSAYDYGSELAAAVQNCIGEVQLYLDGKAGVKQTTIEFAPLEAVVEEELAEAAN